MKRLMAGIMAAIILLGCCSCGKDRDILLTREDWNPRVKENVNELIRQNENRGEYVVFDFDNTTSIFDIEEQLAIFQLETMSFAIKPENLPEILLTGLHDPKKDLSHLGYAKGSYSDIIADIGKAYAVLWSSFGEFTPQGLSESNLADLQGNIYWQEFATKMRVLYEMVYENESSEVAYPWILNWFSGMTKDEVYSLAARSHEKYMKAETDAITWESPEQLKTSAGQVRYTWTKGISVTENMKELWRALSSHGIDVWVCSASGTEVVRAAVDAFGLHDYCSGILAMTQKNDENGLLVNQYDYLTGYGYRCLENGGWEELETSEGTQTQGKGKVIAIQNVLVPLYDGKGPIAGFMDSTGDYNFCTEFSSLKLVVCFNRGNRKITDGGGLIAEVAMYEDEILRYDLKKAQKIGDTLYLLQGRDENGMRSFLSGPMTRCLGQESVLFCNEDNNEQYKYFITHDMTVKDILDSFCLKTEKNNSCLGLAYGFLNQYDGYHSILC